MGSIDKLFSVLDDDKRKKMVEKTKAREAAAAREGRGLRAKPKPQRRVPGQGAMEAIKMRRKQRKLFSSN